GPRAVAGPVRGPRGVPRLRGPAALSKALLCGWFLHAADAAARPVDGGPARLPGRARVRRLRPGRGPEHPEDANGLFPVGAGGGPVRLLPGPEPRGGAGPGVVAVFSTAGAVPGRTARGVAARGAAPPDRAGGAAAAVAADRLGVEPARGRRVPAADDP